MPIVNLTHGDLSILAAFLAVVVVETLGLNPFVTLVLVAPFMAALGYGLQTLVREVVNSLPFQSRRAEAPRGVVAAR